MRVGLVVGCGAESWDDLWEQVGLVREMGKFDVTCCVKLAGVYYPEAFDVWATLHPEYMDDYERQRLERGLPNGYAIVSVPSNECGEHSKKGQVARRVSYRFDRQMTGSASSGIYGAKVLLDEGCDRVALVGVPLTASRHFSRGRDWRELGSFTQGFEHSLPYLTGRVRSASGMTKDRLGAPTPEWLAGG